MKVGFIGTGSMGSLLIESFIHSNALKPQQISASNRTYSKVAELARRYPGLHAAQSNRETAADSDILFICVKPLESKAVTDEIRNVITEEQIVVSITSPVQIRILEHSLKAKVSKIIPSITHQVGSGASLCIHGSRITEEDRSLLEELMSHISRPIRVKESHTRITSDFSSCGPAFLAFFMDQWIHAAVQATGIDRTELCALAGEMIIGTGKLLTEGGMTPAELQARVAVPGGITAEALALLDISLRSVFPELIRATHNKYEEDMQKIDASFGLKQINPQQY
ncbi:competence protein [Paenibacillus sp. IHB B 3084]|uniref:late competence protein ComER n=1 Tax=Paenibacillus sp. IHB B 3084 TaxID=867076 RepID=UPI000721FB8C|nr:late competence protein ComER [Paenibacillus sp. IHB B 3084]ALP38307.1 competence protein [Paenibacillus sp. IHB B 3084]